MTPDRVAEALAALEAAEKAVTPGRWEFQADGSYADVYADDAGVVRVWVAGTDNPPDAEFIARWRNAAPALLKLAAVANGVLDESRECWHPELAAALDELAAAVLGP
jgi:hypothetical protein